MVYDDEVLNTFLNNQSQLFDEKVADNIDEADAFLDDCCAIVKNDKKSAIKYMKDEADCTGLSDEEILGQPEVFEIADGRYLIVEG